MSQSDELRVIHNCGHESGPTPGGEIAASMERLPCPKCAIALVEFAEKHVDLKGTLTDKEQLHLRGAIRLLRMTPSVGLVTTDIADTLDGIRERLGDGKRDQIEHDA